MFAHELTPSAVRAAMIAWTIALAIWIQEIFLFPEFWFSLRLIIIVNEIKDETSVR